MGVGFLVLALPVFLLLRFLCKQADERAYYFNPIMFALGVLVSLIAISSLPHVVPLLISGQFSTNTVFAILSFFFLPGFVGAMFIAHSWTKDIGIFIARMTAFFGALVFLAGLVFLLGGAASYSVGWLATTIMNLIAGIYLLYSAYKKKDKLFAGFNG